MQFKTFDEGFRYELANRDFARISMTRLRSRTRDRADAEFWASYARLEEFSQPIYGSAAQRLGVTYSTPFTARLRGRALGAAPRPLLVEILRYAYPRTVEYAEDVKWMRSVGPESEREFLRYMEEQEEVQVAMMNATLRRRFDDNQLLVNDFISAWRGAL